MPQVPEQAHASFAQDLATAPTQAAALEIFERKIGGYGYHYCDAGSFDLRAIANPKAACRYFICNYLDEDPWGYLPRGWPKGDDAFAALCRSVVPIDYVAFAEQAPRTPANLAHLGLLKLWNIRHAWMLPYNTPDRAQFATVYARNGTPERFHATRWTMFVLGAMLVGRLEELLPADPSAATASDLSEREFACLSGVKRGHSNGQIAAELGISENTVRYHMKKLFKKLGVRSRTEAALHDL